MSRGRAFGVEQADGEGCTKVRIIDDLRRNGVNECAGWTHQTTNEAYDDITRAVLDVIEETGSARVSVEDFRSAYKMLLPAVKQEWLSHTIVYDTGNQHWAVCRLISLPFGGCGSVVAWHRVADAIKKILRRMFGLPILVSVVDIHLIRSGPSAEADQRMLQAVVDMFGR